MNTDLMVALNLMLTTGVLGICIKSSFQAGKVVQRLSNLENRVKKIDGIGVTE